METFNEQPDYPIEAIDEFSVLTKNGLLYIGIAYSSDLALLSYKDLYRISYIGKAGRESILKYCGEHHITLSHNSFFSDSTHIR